MNKYDVAGILKTYSELSLCTRDKEHLKDIIRRLKKELDLRKIESEGE